MMLDPPLQIFRCWFLVCESLSSACFPDPAPDYSYCVITSAFSPFMHSKVRYARMCTAPAGSPTNSKSPSSKPKSCDCTARLPVFPYIYNRASDK
ncbi:hypothetical protein BJ742DRAFT_217663 [Cladochytrium replicatum]|nr:hypothetical protein BJ742DRAFT_217663 [Cladochytrium replicatum]